MATPNYSVNYEDKRFTSVEADKKAAVNNMNKVYDGMIEQSDKYYQAQMDAAKEWGETQAKNQQEQTDFAIEQIEQQKEQAQKDYTKEQAGAYVDWQKQSNQYGANAEEMAAQGMENTGFAESSQVSMYNTYQNRVATARESYNRAVLNYDNAIKDARLQNNALLAEIAYNALQKQLELSLAGFQYKNQLIIAKSDKQLELDNTYYGRYQDVLSQINTENALAEEVRQYNESLAEEKRQHNQNYSLKVKEYEEGIRQFNQEIARLKAKDAKENALAIQQLELQKDKLAEEKRQFDKQYGGSATITKSSGGGSSKSSGGSSKKKSSGSTSSSSNISKTKNSRSGGATTTKKTSSSKATIDMNSVIALGYGPISEARLKQLVDSGLVQQYQSGNKIKFKKSPFAFKQSKLFR